MSFKRINGKLVKTSDAKEPEVVVRDGHRMAVLRPMTPEAAAEALRRAEGLVGKRDTDDEFQKILSDQGKMTFVGLLGSNGRVLDPQTLSDLGPLVPGDSFVSYDDMLTHREHFETEPPS